MDCDPKILSGTTVEGTEDSGHEHAEEAVFNAGILIIFFMLMLYMLFEAYKHKKDLKFGHEASLVCVVGLAISAIMWFYSIGEFSEMMTFNDNLFFYFVLPPIVFASGFNMYRKKFFGNLTNILIFGVCSTLITFALFSTFTMLISNNLTLYENQYDTETQ
jgi:NhaP-type Na+/H+ or K+/H+ antiporter